MILARERCERRRSTAKKGNRHAKQFPQFCLPGERVRARLSRIPHSRRLRALSSRRGARGHEVPLGFLQGGQGTSSRLDGGRGSASGSRATNENRGVALEKSASAPIIGRDARDTKLRPS